MSGLPMPAAVKEILSVDARVRAVARYRWLKDNSIALPDILAGSVSDDSPMSAFLAKNDKQFFFGSKLNLIFWKESEKIVVCFNAVSKSFRKTTASVIDSFGMICL
jgi:hypothetical protein